MTLRGTRWDVLALGVLAALAACGDSSAPSAPTEVRMDFTQAKEFFASPFPSEARRTPDGIDLASFPRGSDLPLVGRVIAAAASAKGFGTTSTVFFSLSGALGAGAKLPDAHASLAKDSPVALVDVDASSPDAGRSIPVISRFLADGGPFGAPNLLAVLPVQGIPLRPNTLYAAVVRTSLRDAEGRALAPSSAMVALSHGAQPAGMSAPAFASYTTALEGLRKAGIPTEVLAGLTVFRTGDPTAELVKVRAHALARPNPAPLSSLVKTDTFDDFCVYASTVRMPVYQSGAPPYAETGGGFVTDAAGEPVLQGEAEANLVVTVPRSPMPSAGYPAVVFSRTGGGGDRPLVDRGTQATNGGPAIAPGTGPALQFARAGFAGVSIDGPHGGRRNVTHDDEQFLMFNVTNPVALRDNVRQSALEIALAPHILAALTFSAADCTGAGLAAGDGTVRFDGGTMALMGHSMGATIAPLAAAIEPMFRAIILSGAGGSWIANIIDKKKPLPVRGAAELFLGLPAAGDYHLTEHDPLLGLFQWGAESADPPVYAPRLVREPRSGEPARHVLMIQGIVDHYILPSIANATTLSVGLDLAGGSLDAKTPELAAFTPAESVLDLVGRRSIALPASGNVTSPSGERVTAVVVQHAEDGLEDGHEVAFQTDAPKRQYRCFLASLAKGIPSVPDRGAADAPCD